MREELMIVDEADRRDSLAAREKRSSDTATPPRIPSLADGDRLLKASQVQAEAGLEPRQGVSVDARRCTADRQDRRLCSRSVSRLGGMDQSKHTAWEERGVELREFRGSRL